MEENGTAASEKYIYQDGRGMNARIHPPVLPLSVDDQVTWENLTGRPVELHFPGGERYLTEPEPVTVDPGETSPPKTIKRGAPKRAYVYRAVQIGQGTEPDVEVHGNSNPILIIR
jgi:hypothetical protein